jgi:hypothetical protein
MPECCVARSLTVHVKVVIAAVAEGPDSSCADGQLVGDLLGRGCYYSMPGQSLWYPAAMELPLLEDIPQQPLTLASYVATAEPVSCRCLPTRGRLEGERCMGQWHDAVSSA